jgi:hypothetical protein
MLIVCVVWALVNPSARHFLHRLAFRPAQAVDFYWGHAVAGARRPAFPLSTSTDVALLAPNASTYSVYLRRVASSASIPAALARPPPATPPRQASHNVEVYHQLLHKGMER